MKKVIILFILTLVAFSCEKEKKIEPRKHPYFSCMINGEYFYAQGKWQCQPLVFNYYPNGYLGAPIGYTVIGGVDCSVDKSIGIRIYGLTLANQTIDFASNQIDSVSPFYFYPDEEKGEFVVFNNWETGSLTFSEFTDRNGDTNGLVSGTFEFSVHNEELDSIVEITDGKFQYIIEYEWY